MRTENWVMSKYWNTGNILMVFSNNYPKIHLIFINIYSHHNVELQYVLFKYSKYINYCMNHPQLIRSERL